MIVLPFAIVVAVVAVVYTTRRRHVHATPVGRAGTAEHRHAELSPTGVASLVTLGAGLVLWALTRTSLPLYFAGAVGGVAVVLAVIAVVRFGDRSPMLLLPLVFVPLAAVATALFVLLS